MALPLALQLQRHAEEAEERTRIAHDEANATQLTLKPLTEPDAPETGDIAIGGQAGTKARDLLDTAAKAGQRLLAGVMRSALTRTLKDGRGLLTLRGMRTLFSPEEREALSAGLASILAPANLLGRSRIRRRVEDTAESFADAPLRPMAPAKAVAYFQSLTPGMKVDPQAFEQEQRRQAFTLAVSTEKALLDRVKGLIAQSLERGDSTTSTAKQVQDLLDKAGVSPRNSFYSTMVVRTNIQDALNTGQTEEMQDPDVADFFPVWQYQGIDDARASLDHRQHFDKYYPNTVTFAQVRGKRVWNCVLPGNLVAGRFLAASKAFYSGDAVEVYSRDGSRLTLTVNHPVLTPRGFVAAGKLKPGDQLLCDQGQMERTTGVDYENAPALIEDVFSAFSVIANRAMVTPVSAVDFHGDGVSCQGEINVVRPDWSLLRDWVLHNPKHGSEAIFNRADVHSSFVPRLRTLALDFEGVLLAAASDMSGFDLLRSRLVCHALPLQQFSGVPAADGNSRLHQNATDDCSAYASRVGKLLLRLASNIASNDRVLFPEERGLHHTRIGAGSRFDACLLEPAGNNGSLDSKFFSELAGRYSGEILLDGVAEIRRFHYDGPVYDLESPLGYYSASRIGKSIIIANCRCGQRAIDAPTWDELQAKGARLADGYSLPRPAPKPKPVKNPNPTVPGGTVERDPLTPVRADPNQSVAAAFKRLDKGYNQVAIADLKDATGLDVPTLHQSINDLRRQGILTGSQAERQIDDRMAATAIREGDGRLIYVGIRTGKEADLAAVAAAAPAPAKSAPSKSKGDVSPPMPAAVLPGQPAPTVSTPEAAKQVAAKVAADKRSEEITASVLKKHDQAHARIEAQIAEQKKATVKAFVTGTDEERKRIEESLKQAEDDRQTLRELARDDLIKQLAPAETHTLKTTNTLSGQAKSRAKFGVNFVQKVLAKLPGDGQLPGVTFVKTEKGERANFKDYYGDGRIALGRNDDEGTAVHELGHYIEEKVPGVREAVQAFLRHRVGDEPLKSMRAVDPGAKYGKDEMGREDDFAKYFGKSHAHYVGKYYEDGSTEVLSMGIEALHRDPVGFMKADPEYARFVIGVLNGSIRK